MNSVGEFLDTVLTAPTDGDGGPMQAYACICVSGNGGVGLNEHWFEWPHKSNDALSLLNETISHPVETYFIPHLFALPNAQTDNLLPSRVVTCDIDATDVNTLGAQPSLLVQTSTNHHQGYWLLRDFADIATVELINRNFAYDMPMADKLKWPALTPYRVPFMPNHKYVHDGMVQLVKSSPRVFDIQDLENVPDPPFMLEDGQLEWLNNLPAKPKRGPHEILKTMDGPEQARLRVEYDIEQPTTKRADYIWTLLLQATASGMQRDDIYWLAKLSPNNPYRSLRFNGDKELAKEVLRAEAFLRTRVRDTRKLINDARNKLVGSPHEKRQQLYAIVYDSMQQDGEFLRTREDYGYYIGHSRGRPIPILEHSTQLKALLDVSFGLNRVEQDYRAVASSMESMVQQMPITGTDETLSYFMPHSNALYIHSGRRDMYRVTSDRIEKMSDGGDGVVFPWPTVCEPFNPILDHKLDRPWYEYLLGDGVDNVIGMTRGEATALLVAWLFTLLFRNIIKTKPILAMFGSPGSGKSTMFRRVFTFLYGASKELNSVTNATEFDYAVSSNPLVVLDNVDTVNKWLLDKLAIMINETQWEKHKLYDDIGTIVMRRTAMLGVTAHRPQFNRGDIADRLVIITLERFEQMGKQWIGESVLFRNLAALRNQIWGGLLQDVQKILATPQPQHNEVPQFRIEDYAYNGYWFCKALGLEKDFSNAIKLVVKSQQGFALEEEHLLIAAIESLVASKAAVNGATDWLSAGALYSKLAAHSRDEEGFQRQYGSPTSFGHHLSSIRHTLREMFTIEWKPAKVGNGRLWRIVKVE